MSQAKQSYMGDIDMVDEIIEGEMAVTPFPDEMLPLSRHWSILRSGANLAVPQQAHTHLVPEYSYNKDTKVFHFSCIVGMMEDTFVDVMLDGPMFDTPMRVLIKQ